MRLILSKLSFCLPIALLTVFFRMASARAEETRPKLKSSETLKVIGSRTEGRKAIDAAAPVDFIFGDDLVKQGDTDIANILRTFVPSFNVTAQPISDASTFIRPANLRGLPPDSTLILVNGKRQHRSAVISFLGQGIADGAQGPDISVIPAIALQSVEVLRDGAAAQYGSDAIAGVMNFVLKDADQGGTFQAKYGQFYAGDGKTAEYAANVGFPLLERGFGNLSLEYSNSAATDRSVQRDDAKALIAGGNSAVADPAQAWGQPQIKDSSKFFANFGQELNSNLSLYAFGNYASRKVKGGFYFRNPNTRDGVYSNDGGLTRLVGDLRPGNTLTCPSVATGDSVGLEQISSSSTPLGGECFTFNEMFPGGFTPSFGGELRDVSAVTGARGELSSGLHYDLSTSIGLNQIDFFIDNTVNATFGPETPTSFKPGSYIQREKQFNFDLSYPLSLDLFASPLNIAGGVERRREEFQIKKGDDASYMAGPLASQGFGIGSNGFSGFSPDVAGTFDRWNEAFYLDLETDVTKDLLLGVAARAEDFEDFGSTNNGKISMRYNIIPSFAVRSTASTGFRAPTPGQSNVSNISTTFENGKLANRGTIPPTNPIAKLRGGEQLKPEKSENYTLGAIFTLEKLRASLDYFSIVVRDRITQSASQTLTAAEASQLETDGIAGASGLQTFRFYTNGFNTKTEGLDLVISQPISLLSGVTILSFTGNWTKTKVISHVPGVLDAKRIRQLEAGLPATRFNLAATYLQGPWRNLVRLNYFGKFFEAHLDDASLLIEAGDETTIDVETAYTLPANLTLAFGAQNLLNEYPDEHPYQGIAGAKYPETSPMGFNGGFWYTRMGYNF